MARASASVSAAAGTAEPSKSSPFLPPPFLSKTYEMVDDPATDAVVSWSPDGSSFVVWSPPELERVLLPKYFKHKNFSSFVRQLNTYGFKKVDPDKYEFVNEGFLRGQKHLLKSIKRKQPVHGHNQPHQPIAQDASVAACIEVGKFGLEEEIERLKSDKDVLKQELVRLKQHQQTTDSQLQTLGQCLYGMEQRQQQMMSFLAKAMQSPGVVAQLVQQSDNNRRIDARNRKRRLPNQGDDLDGKQASSDCQIIKYQPLMIEAAKEMLMQLLEMNVSPRLSKSNGLLPVALDSESSSSSNMGVSLAEVTTSSRVPYVPTTSGSSDICTSSAVSEVFSSLTVTDMVASSTFPDISLLSAIPESNSSCQTDSIPEFTQMQGNFSDGNTTDIPCVSCAVPEAEKAYADTILSGMDDKVPTETQMLSADTDTNSLYDEIEKLPGSVDPFWEQFLVPDQVSCDTDEVDPSLDVMEDVYTEQGNGWDNAWKIARLREQLGLLNSDIEVVQS